MNWTRAKAIVWEELSGGALLVNPATGARWILNATAAAIWKLCDGRSGSAELAHVLSRSSAEIASFCAQFSQMGLLTPAPIYATSSGANPTAYKLTASILTARLTAAPSFKPLSLGHGIRRRPTARGLSGPA